jgi:4-hydroxymandelate oxidase
MMHGNPYHERTTVLPLLADQENTARQRMKPSVYDYYATGSGDETTLDEASQAWRRYRLRPRVLCDVTSVDTSVELLGQRLRTPVLVAPTAFHQGAHPDGEVATARGTAGAGSLLVLSSRSSRRIEEVAAAAGPWWFQVYVMNDPKVSDGMVRRAVAAGAAALVLTVDTPYTGVKKRPSAGAPQLGGPPVTDEQFMINFAEHLDPELDPFESANQYPGCTFDTLRELTGHGVPVLAKGVLRGDDALACVEAGAAGIVVSNHGGRQLDRAVATADALPEVVEAVGGRVPVLVDGGIRSGLDVLTALALGANAVLLGRPVLWALATAGAAGVTAALDAVTSDLAHVLALSGAPSAGVVPRDLIAGAPPRP